MFQLSSRDSELDSVKDRYNAALQDVGVTFGHDVLSSICVQGFTVAMISRDACKTSTCMRQAKSVTFDLLFFTREHFQSL